MLGVLGTSLSFGADLANRTKQAWPARLEDVLRSQHKTSNIWVLNGAMRASSADFAALCYQ